MKVELLRTKVLYFLTDSLYSFLTFLKVKMFNFQEKCLLLFPKHAKFHKQTKRICIHEIISYSIT